MAKRLLALVLTTGFLAAAGLPARAEGGRPLRSHGLYRAPAVARAAAGDEILVRFRDGASPLARGRARAAAGVRRVRDLRVPGWEVASSAEGASLEAAAASLRRQPGVADVIAGGVASALDTTPDDDYFSLQYALHNTGQVYAQTQGGSPISGTTGADIDAPAAWDAGTGSDSIVVAVVDTGVTYTHPDLSPAIWTNAGEIGGGKETNGADDDGNGYVDDWRGWDWVDNDNTPLDEDAEPHGTHVAGIIGAQGNDGAGVTGVAWDVSIMPLRVLGDGWGSMADIAEAMTYAAANGADVVNLSLGGDSGRSLLKNVIDGAPGTLFVAAAGNSNQNVDTDPLYPCSITSANLVCVAATDDDDARASFSNYGATAVDLGAPGLNILSTWSGGDWGYMSGTSMATPVVSGAAALLLAAKPSATPTELKAALLDHGDPLSGLSGKTVTGKRLNVAQAVTALLDPPAFDDVLPGHPYYDQIQAIAAAGITSGCSSSPPRYCPSAKVTRGQMAVFLIRALDLEAEVLAASYQATFSDVSADLAYAPYIERLYELGVTTGCKTEPLRYCPSSSVTRSQMAMFILRALGHAGVDHLPSYTGYFTDVLNGVYDTPSIEHFFEHGITSGCGGGKYCRSAAVTRGQMAVFLTKAFDLTA